MAAIYSFARTADDLADEGEASAEARLADLAAYRADLRAVAAGTAASSRWPAVFMPLGTQLRAHALPLPLLEDLLSAFEQDVVQHDYADRLQLLDYCRRSANPIGRLLLHLYGIDDPLSLRQSDAICTALQLANFWQDLGVDTRRRAPLHSRRRSHAPWRGGRPNFLRNATGRRCMRWSADVVGWARELIALGRPARAHHPGPRGLGVAARRARGLPHPREDRGARLRHLAGPPHFAWPRWGADAVARIAHAPASGHRGEHGRMTPQQYVQDKAAASGSSFYYAFLFLPPPRRAAITAFYAFCREVDDVVDEVSGPRRGGHQAGVVAQGGRGLICWPAEPPGDEGAAAACG